MRTISKILVSVLALVPLLAFATTIEDVVPPEPPLPHKYSQEYVIEVIKDVWGDDASVGLKIAKCESGYYNLAVNYEDSKLNGHVSRGLFQLSEINGVIPLWWEPKVNAQKAYAMFLKQGVRPWTNCALKNNLL